MTRRTKAESQLKDESRQPAKEVFKKENKVPGQDSLQAPWVPGPFGLGLHLMILAVMYNSKLPVFVKDIHYNVQCYNFKKLACSSIYPALRKLKQLGLIKEEGEQVTTLASGVKFKPAKFYSITDDGARFFLEVRSSIARLLGIHDISKFDPQPLLKKSNDPLTHELLQTTIDLLRAIEKLLSEKK